MENEKAISTEVKQKKELAVSAKGYLIPNSLDTQWQMATIFAKSGLAPKGMERTETLFTAIQLGAEVGLAPMQAIQSIAVINGRPTVWGDAQLALVKAHPDYEYIKERIDGQKAICEIKRKGEIVPVIQEFSVEDAKRAGLWDKSGPWKQYPKRMLQMRARGFAIRDCFPDVLKGLSVTAEEAIDLVQTQEGVFTAEKVNDVIKEVNKTTGEIKEPPKEEKSEDPWDRANWIRLRTGGFEEYVKNNFSTLQLQPEEVIAEVRNKWYGLYADTEFPGEKEEKQEPEPPALDQNTPERIECPNRNGEPVFTDFCHDECKLRKGCPAWD